MKRSPINFSGIFFEVALLTLALVAAITLIRIGSAVAAEHGSSLPRAQATADKPGENILARDVALVTLQPNSDALRASR